MLGSNVYCISVPGRGAAKLEKLNVSSVLVQYNSAMAFVMLGLAGPKIRTGTLFLFLVAGLNDTRKLLFLLASKSQ